MIDIKALEQARAQWLADPEFRRIAGAYLAAYREGPGALVLEHMTVLFGGNTWHADPHEHAYRTGLRGVLLHIETLRHVAANPPETPHEPA